MHTAAQHTTNGSFQNQLTRTLGPSVRVCQLNIEGISRSKSEYLSKFLLDRNIDVVLLQETHTADESQLQKRGKIFGYKLVGATYHAHYGIATYARANLDNVKLVSISEDEDIFTIHIEAAGIHIVNVYKPPATKWPNNLLPAKIHPTIYAGDFNSHHTQWRYNRNDQNGTKLVEWAETEDIQLVFSAKQKCTFRSARWKSETNPDLCFVSTDHNGKPVQVNRYVLEDFPHSQHRPIMLEVGTQIPVIRSTNHPRWNFAKADWKAYSSALDKNVRFIDPLPTNYHRFAKMVISTAKKHIPRGVRREYIPCWSEANQLIYEDYVENGRSDVADTLLQNLDEARKKKWNETTRNLNFKHSSKKAWNLLKKLGADSHSGTKPADVTADQIANRVVSLSRAKKDKMHSTIIKKDFKALKQTSTTQEQLSGVFTSDEVTKALQLVKNGKSPGFDNIHPEFLTHCGINTKRWLAKFFTNVLQSEQLPSEFKRTKIIAILKPGKPADLPESYRPIALLSVTYKLLERLIYNRINPLILEILPIEQAGFRPGRNCEDQVLALTTFIERGFEERSKTGVVFIDLTAAYDTVWREGLMYKFLNITRCNKLTSLVNNMLSNRIFQISIGSTLSRPRLLNNGLPQGSVLAPLLFNLYTADLPLTSSRKFMYADDLALAKQHVNMGDLETTLSDDLSILSGYFQRWRLTPSITKTESCCFHLNNRMASNNLNIIFNDSILRHNHYPKYLGVTLDRTLSFNKHLTNLAAKLRTRNNILYKLAGSTWGADASTLRTSALSLVFPTAEYCASVWLNSPYVSKVDTVLNQTMRIITGSIKSTPIEWLPVLCHIEPPKIRRQQILVREFKKVSGNLDLPIHQDIIRFNRLKSRNPTVKTAQQLITNNFNGHNEWISNWQSKVTPAWHSLLDPDKPPQGFNMPRKTWVRLNRIRTGHGRSGAALFKWGMGASPECDCGAASQTMHHITYECPTRAFSGSTFDLLHATPQAIQWLNQLNMEL